MKKHLTTPTIIKGKRKHGFLRRMRSRSGKLVLSRRRRKGRRRLTI